MSEPLAERMRPHTLADYVGQQHLVGEGAVLRKMIDAGRISSFILWGPPGVGKTTLAQIVAQTIKVPFFTLSAVTSGVKDVREVIERAKSGRFFNSASPILFIDEIHRFNKAQQDAFLPHVESGLITLIGATTENPSFEIINPLLSRSRVLVLEPLTKDDMLAILKHAVETEKVTKRVGDEALDYIAELSGGDARVALGNLELALNLDKKVTIETVKTAAQKRVPGYDKKGDMHYNVISAFIKSMRGSNVDATLYYLARMIDAGEDPKFIARRMVIFASEDIGLAGNGALGLALNAFQAVERVGMPESSYVLFHVASALAKAEKSRQTTDAMNNAQRLAKQYPDAPVPLHLRNAPTKLMKDLGYAKDYKWEADFKHNKGFLPDEIANEKIF